MTEPTRTNVQIPVPQDDFQVEEGLPNLPTTGRQGQSKYSKLIEQARGLKANQHFKVPTGGVPRTAFIRNLRVAIKRFASGMNLKVTAVEGTDNQVAVYRAAEGASA